MVGRYCKRSEVTDVEAIKYKGKVNYDEVCQFVGQELKMLDDSIIVIPKSTRDEIVYVGDYIVKSNFGSCYSYKKDVFEKKYQIIYGDND